MYNTSKIESIKKEIQKEIDEVIEKYEPIMNEAIKAQIPKTNRLRHGMGITVCENKLGYEVGEKFTREINQLCFKDEFRTGMTIEDVPFR